MKKLYYFISIVFISLIVLFFFIVKTCLPLGTYVGVIHEYVGGETITKTYSVTFNINGICDIVTKVNGEESKSSAYYVIDKGNIYLANNYKENFDKGDKSSYILSNVMTLKNEEIPVTLHNSVAYIFLFLFIVTDVILCVVFAIKMISDSETKKWYDYY